jgi:glycosyltransferase involved in cell wall biosynthesis
VKILFINNLDIVGGAAIATKRLMQSLARKYQVEYFYVIDVSKTTSYSLPSYMRYARDSMFKKVIESVINRWFAKFGYLYTFLPFSKRNIKSIVDDFQPDLIVLNNIHGGYFQISLIEELSKSRPIVWILHDMWAITGKCEYSYDCDRWVNGCGNCPYLNEYPVIYKDKTEELWQIKRKVYENSNLTIVTPSKWLYSLVKKSPLLKDKRVYHIPYVIDLDIFKAKDKKASKKALEIEINEKVIMFAPYDIKIKRKGFDLLLQVLKNIDLRLKEKVTLLLVGNSLDGSIKFKNFNIKEIGFIQNEKMLSICYNASDIFLLPSRNDNYPLVLMEAISCGVPSITFDIGGCGEIVENGKNGFAVTPFCLKEFEDRLYLLLESPEILDQYSENCKSFAKNSFSNGVTKYYELFKNLVEAKDG